MKKSILILLACTVGMMMMPSGKLSADDFGTGIELEASKKVTKQLKVGVSAEARTQDGVDNTERWAIGVDANYKLFGGKKSNWKGSAAVGYSFIDRYKPAHLSKSGKNKIHEYWQPRHRATASFTLGYKLTKKFTLSLRERYQYTYLTEQFVERTKVKNGKRNDDKIVGDEDRQMLRSRLQLKWESKKSPWEPYASVEAFCDAKDAFGLDQLRYVIGTKYNLNKNNAVGLSYHFKDRMGTGEESDQLVKASYSFSF